MELPARIGKYELQEFLGGGMSHVYRARDTVIGRTVAVKILTEQGCADADAKKRFLAEARMAGGMSHENVIAIYDFGEDERQRPFMVMEFLRGEDLRQAIREGHTGDLGNKLRIALEIGRAIEYIHSQKIIHRDIKPENIHLSTTGAVKLMDFGIAKAEGLALTRAGFVLGTPYYMAPEQVLGKGVTELVDVYAFGVVLYELLTGGVKPVSGETLERIFQAIMREPLNLEPLFKAGVPQPVVDLVVRCTAKDPADRPQGFGAVCQELERLRELVETGAAPQTGAAWAAAAAPAATPAALPAAAQRKRWLIPAIAAAVVVVAAAVWFALRTSPQAPELPPRISTPTGEMVLVPGGPFLSGAEKASVAVPAFYIDETEVTNAAYARFAKAAGRPLPPDFEKHPPDHPVVGVTIVDAQAFARWAGKRLPTAREWEKAARGSDGRHFPWGDQPDASRANVGSGAVRPAKDFAPGASPYGALQMVGNVWEFVDQLSTPAPAAFEHFRGVMQPPPDTAEPWYGIRGLAFDSQIEENALYESTTVPARWRGANIGFRCVRDP